MLDVDRVFSAALGRGIAAGMVKKRKVQDGGLKQKCIRAFFPSIPGAGPRYSAQNGSPPSYQLAPGGSKEGQGEAASGGRAATAGNRQGGDEPGFARFACTAQGDCARAAGAQPMADQGSESPPKCAMPSSTGQPVAASPELQQAAAAAGPPAGQQLVQAVQQEQHSEQQLGQLMHQAMDVDEAPAGQQQGQQQLGQQEALASEPAVSQQQNQQQQQEQGLGEGEQQVMAAAAAAEQGAARSDGGADNSSGDAGPRAGSGKAAGAAVDGTAGTAGLTAYELERLERIRRNQEVMLSMGLGRPGIPPRKPPAAAAAARKKAPRRHGPSSAAAADGGISAAGAPAAPVRRSARNRGLPAGQGGATAAAGQGQQEQQQRQQAEDEAEVELQYDDSSVRRYVCEVLAGSGTAGGGTAGTAGVGAGQAFPSTLGTEEGDGSNGGSGGSSSSGGGSSSGGLTGFRQLPGCLHDPALTRAYSVDWRPGLVVAGGKDGVVSVFGSRQLEAGGVAADDVEPPLLSHKLHKGWVADVQFVSSPSASSSIFAGSGITGSGTADGSGSGGGDAAPLLLLTAGNDGSVCLWDLGRSAEVQGGRGRSVPQCLAKTTDLHGGGIFSLHELEGRVLTASKDCTLAISRLEGGSTSGTAALAAVQRYDELHEGVVKCARWRDGSTFASCGNDRQLCVTDTRQPPSAGASLAIAGAHGTAISCLRWHPSFDHLLLSSSHDPHILLHDLRSPGQPLHRFTGHSQAARIGSIYQPAFVGGGAAVATPCERSDLLSLYCTSTGATISRGSTGLAAIGATHCGKGRGDPLLCTATKAVYLFAPTFAP